MYEQNREFKVKRRNRPSLVCNACRQRKIKCNRGRPCLGCVKNKLEHLCKYDDNWPIKNKKRKLGASPEYSDSIKHPIAVIPILESPGSNTTDSDKINTKNLDVSANSMMLIEKSQFEALKAKLQKFEAKPPASNALKTITETIVLSDDGLMKTTALNQNIGECPIRGRVLHNPESPGEVNNSCFYSTHFNENKENVEGSGVNNPWITSQPYKSRNAYVGVNPYQEKDETIDLFDDSECFDIREPSRSLNGAFNWSSVWRHDTALVLLKQYSQFEKFQSGKGGTLVLSRTRDGISDRNSASYSSTDLNIKTNNGYSLQNSVSEISPDPTSEIMRTDKTSSESTREFERKVLESNSYMHYKTSGKNGKIANQRRRSLNNSAIPLGLTLFDTQMDRELKLVEQLKHTLPKKKVIWLLMKRFFRLIYPFFPYLDEIDFRQEINRIIGAESYEDKKLKNIYVEKRIDLANLGTLLVVLRLSYLSLFSNKCSVNNEKLNTDDLSMCAQETKYLLSNPVNINAIDTGQVCLHQFQFSRKYNLAVLQCALFIRFYHKYAPEDGDGADGGDSQISNSILIQMAYSIGLNREPDNLRSCVNNERLNNLGRKIWHSLLINDFMNAYTYGSPLASSGMHYDTKEPFYKEGNENALNGNLDKAIANCHGFAGGLIFGPMKDILTMTSSLKKDIKMSELTVYLNSLEVCLNKLFGELGDYTNVLESEGDTYAFVKMTKAGSLLSLKGFYLSVYFYLTSYYDKKKDHALSFFYLSKLLTTSIGELCPNLFLLICKGQEIFGEGADLFINPHLERIIHIINEINISVLIRLNFSLHRMIKDPGHRIKLSSDADYNIRFQTLGKFVVLLENCARVCVLGTSIMSQRYYYAWGINRSHSFLLRIVKNEEFYLQNMNANIGVENITTYQLQKLIDMTESSFTHLNSIVTAHCEEFQVQRLFDLRNQPQIPSILLNTSVSSTPDSSTNMVDHTNSYDSVDFSGASANSSDSTAVQSDLDNFNLGTSAEIDSLWFQMLSIKNQKRNFTHDQDYMVWNNTSLPNTDQETNELLDNQITDQKQNQLHASNFGFEFPNTQRDNTVNEIFNIHNTDDIDMFSDLPLDQIFSQNMS